MSTFDAREPTTPWPLAIGLLAASLTTLLGSIAGHDPETILHRSIISCVAVWSMGLFVRGVWKFVTTHNEL